MKNLSAFPTPPVIGDKGMSLRDYFAAKAMQAIISGEYATRAEFKVNDAETVAERSYEYANAMLAASDKRS